MNFVWWETHVIMVLMYIYIRQEKFKIHAREHTRIQVTYMCMR